MVEHHAAIHSDVARDVVGDRHALQLVGDALHLRQQEIQHRDLAFGSAHVVLGARAVGQPVEVALGAVEALLVGLGAALLAVLVGVEVAIEFHDAHLHALGQQQVDGALGRIGARRVRIEVDGDAVRVAFDGLHLLRR